MIQNVFCLLSTTSGSSTSTPILWYHVKDAATGVHKFSKKYLEPPQNSWQQEIDTKHAPN